MNERNDITSARWDQRMQTEGNGILQPQRPQHGTFHVPRRLLMEEKPLFIQACRARVSMLSLLVTVLLLYYLDGFIPPFTYWIYLGDWGYCFSLWLYSFFHLPFLYSLTYCLSPVVWKRLSTHFLLRPLSMICWHQTDTVLLLGILSLCWLMGAFNPLDLLQASLHLM